MKISKSIAFGLICAVLSQTSHGQIVTQQTSGGTSMHYQISSPSEGINLDLSRSTNIYSDFGAANIAARAWALNCGSSVAVGETSFSVSAQANAQVQVFGSQSYLRYGLASGLATADLFLEFANPTLISVSGTASGSGSATHDTLASGSGGGNVQIVFNQAQTVISGFGADSADPPTTTGSANRVGLGQTITISLTASASASGQNYPDYQLDALGAGAGGCSASGTFDTNVINPGSLNQVVFTNFLGRLGGNCTTPARYPTPFTYTGKTGVLDNVQAILFNPPAGLPTAFGGAINGQCSVIYKIGVTQSFDTAIAYKMVANGPLIRFAPLGQTTARIDYPAFWTNTCLFLTDIDFTPPSGSYLPIGTNQGNAHWSSSTGLSGDCPFEIIVKTNLSGVAAHPELLRSEFPGDSDDDGLADWQELLAGTETLDVTSVLKLEAPVLTATNLTLSWPTVPGIRYQVEAGGVAGGGFIPMGDVIMGTAGLAATNVVVPLQSSINRFYRLRVVTD